MTEPKAITREQATERLTDAVIDAALGDWLHHDGNARKAILDALYGHDGDEPTYEVTSKWLHAHATKGLGWSKRQLAVLGIAWPPPCGWLRGLCGSQIAMSQKRQFEALAQVRKSKKGQQP